MKLPIISGQELIKFLAKQGFEISSQKGSHVKLKKKTINETIVTIVPLHKRLDPGTLLGILKQSKIERQDLEKLR